MEIRSDSTPQLTILTERRNGASGWIAKALSEWEKPADSRATHFLTICQQIPLKQFRNNNGLAWAL
jgi:hypothetical protein